jgi:hypothetical protein
MIKRAYLDRHFQFKKVIKQKTIKMFVRQQYLMTITGQLQELERLII